MSDQIGEVLTIAASDAKMSEVLKRERLGEMFIYTAIIYISFFVFLFVVAVMASQFRSCICPYKRPSRDRYPVRYRVGPS